MIKISTPRRLAAGTALSALALAGAVAATPAFAQDTQPQAAQDDANQEIVVTGSLFSTTSNATPSPVTVVDVDNLDRRGVSTVQDAIQQLASNNGPALTNSFSANGAFGAGASAVSLRGLSTNSTLVLFDGMRGAYYPLADDGSRNFVDLNTIPDDIIERVEVLRDGASSTYGADAIAGVVNIITKKEYKGVGGRAEAGISQRGDAAQYRLSMTAGVGDLDDDGYNAYLSGFWYKSDALFNRDRPFPYNSADLRSICFEGTCGANGVLNGLQGDGLLHGLSLSTPFMVRPRNPLTGGVAAGQTTQYQLLNGCQGLTPYTLTAADRALLDGNGNPINAAAPNTVCQEDRVQRYGVINPDVERFGGSARFTTRLGDTGEAYAEFNFLQTNVQYTGLPATIRANAPAGFYYPRYSTSANVATYGNNTVLQLPVYVCAQRVNCSAANGTLNPNNPFAAQGFSAAITGNIPNLIEENETRNRALRGAIGIRGAISDNWDFDVGATAMHLDLRRRSDGYVYIKHLLDVIADGSYNFVNPLSNSQSVLDYLAPTNITNATSDLYQIQGTVRTKLAELPGGPLQLGVGASIRYEAVDAPSANSDFNGATQRYFRLNAFAATGKRTVYSLYGEVNAPLHDALELNLSGRYDRYTGGIDNFSPKIGVKFTPVRQLVVRGTYSRGFRIPSFGEANATFPTTGYVSATRGIYNNFFLSQYGASCNTTTTGFATCPSYVRDATYGQTTLANPNLQPEKSRSFTAGVVFEPHRGLSFTVDYYNIRKTGAITSKNLAPAIEAYYSGKPIPAGYTVVPDAPDVNNPNATPRIAFVQAGFINANTVKAEGLDFGVNIDLPISDGFRVNTSVDASYILNLSTEFPDGTVERYDGTLGNFNLTAGSGTPKLHGSWLTTLDFGSFDLSGTVNYFGGYNLSAMDQGNDYKDCGQSDGSTPCDVSAYVTFDLGARVRVSDRFTFYANVLNLFDRFPPLDPVTYGAYLYNPVQGGSGILGRYFKAGVKVGF